MRQSAERVAAGYSDVQRGGTFQARLEREAAEAYTRRRLAGLDIGDTPLCFGRLDLVADADAGAPPDGPFYVGRISVTDEDLATSPFFVNKQGTLTVNAGKLIGNLEDARRRPLWRILVALSIRHVGPTAARALAAQFGVVVVAVAI